MHIEIVMTGPTDQSSRWRFTKPTCRRRGDVCNYLRRGREPVLLWLSSERKRERSAVSLLCEHNLDKANVIFILSAFRSNSIVKIETTIVEISLPNLNTVFIIFFLAITRLEWIRLSEFLYN